METETEIVVTYEDMTDAQRRIVDAGSAPPAGNHLVDQEVMRRVIERDGDLIEFLPGDRGQLEVEPHLVDQREVMRRVIERDAVLLARLAKL